PGCASLAADLADYLAETGARIHRVDTLEQAVEAARGLAAPVIVHAGIDDREQTARLAAFAGLDGPRHLLVLHGRRRAARTTGAGVSAIDGKSMRRRAFLRAVAAAAGRMAAALPAGPDPAEAGQQAAVVAPTVSEARRQGRLILVAEDDPTNQKVV